MSPFVVIMLVVGGVVFSIAFNKFSTKTEDSEASSTGEAIWGAFMAAGVGMTAWAVVGTILGVEYY